MTEERMWKSIWMRSGALVLVAGVLLFAGGYLRSLLADPEPQAAPRVSLSSVSRPRPGQQPEPATAAAPVAANANGAARPDPGSVEIGRVAPPDRWIPVAEFAAEDTERMRYVNGVLEFVDRPRIPADARIRSRDLEVFREVVDAANKKVDEATQRWRNVSLERRDQLQQELYRKIRAGSTDLPYESEANPMKRRHPYEVISNVMYEGQSYVLRIGVDEEPRLLDAGRAIDEASERRVLDFDTLVRSLFCSGGRR